MKREGCGKVLVRGERCVKVWPGEERRERSVFLVLDEEGKVHIIKVWVKGAFEGFE